MAACLCQGWQFSLLPAILLSLRSPPSAPEPVTSQDAALLADVTEDILCFSRSFEDLTCFWDEEETTTGIYYFYYWYNRDEPRVCMVSMWRHGAGGKRHVCVFPSQDVRLFTQLHLCILDTTTNQTKYWRELSVDEVGLIAPPVNITAHWAGAAGQLCVSWQPPLPDFPNFFLYERLVQADTWVVLRDLQPGVRYHIQVRSKPDGTSMDGVWGPWSQAVAAETPHSSGDIGLCCSTPDLRHVYCEWSWDPAEPHSSHQLFYRPPSSGAGTRSNTCLSPIPTVLTDAPQIVQATVSHGQLSLQWLPPLELLAEQLDYQVRYATENSHDWKVLQVPRGARKEVLDLRPGTRYHAQVRAQPSGPRYQGSWSAWSKPVVVDAVADTGKGLRRGQAGGSSTKPGHLDGASRHPRSEGTFDAPSPVLSNVKQKLWPPVPDLHRALGSFIQESGKHGQASALDKQPLEEAVLPCLLEVLPSPRREAGPPPEHAGGRLSSTDIANQSYLLMSGWEPRGATTAPTPP
ncbi:thrombopoietin receptor isoform X1 [Turdus rufiventris]|nr:thrombopoietin receptor isoform X1 [Turdus rufiventris]